MSLRTRHRSFFCCAAAAWGLCAPAGYACAEKDWQMFRGNAQQTGVAQSTLPDKLEVVWRVDLKEPILSTAAIVEDTVYVGTDDGSFVALSLADGKERWRIKLEEGIRSSPTVLQSDISSFKSQISDPKSESPNLKSRIPAPSDRPSGSGAKTGVDTRPDSKPKPDSSRESDILDFKSQIVNRNSDPKSDYSVYFGDQEGKFHAVNAADGKELWNFSTAGEIVSSANYGNGSVVFGSYDGFIYCLNAQDGTLRWKFETAGRVHGTPAVIDDSVIAAGCDEFLHVISLADGSSQQKVSMGSVSGASVPVDGAMAIVGTYGNSVLGVNWKEAKVAWTFTDPEREFPFMSSAALTPSAAFIGGRDKRVRSLNPSMGAVNWTFATDGKVESSPVVVGNRVFFGSGDGNLYAVDGAKGTELWRYEAGAPISASASVAAEKLVIGNEDGVLYCFGKK